MLSTIRHRLLMDRSVSLAVAARVWQFLAGGVSLYLVAKFFSPELQGFYYAFASLIGSQLFFDLGLGAVLTLVASHEWGRTQEPDPTLALIARQRLGELVRHARRWYVACGVAYAAVVMAGGLWFFAGEGDGIIVWQWPWCCAVLLSSLNFSLIPSLAVLEGCNYMVAIQGCRLLSGLLGSLAVWTCIVSGGGLWAIVASCGVRLIVEGFVVAVQFRGFFREVTGAVSPTEPRLSWKQELLPLQWRVAVQNLFGYLALQAYTPIIFKFHGPVQGGRMGMTWSAVTTIQLAASAWLQTRVPQLGRLLSERATHSARALFGRVLRVSIGMYVAASVSFLALIAVLQRVAPDIAARVLELPTIGLFCLGMGLALVANALGTYVRLHKIDPFLRLGVGSSIVIGVLVWWLGATFGAPGAAWAHLLVTGLLILPATYWIYRRVAGAAAIAEHTSRSVETSPAVTPQDVNSDRT